MEIEKTLIILYPSYLSIQKYEIVAFIDIHLKNKIDIFLYYQEAYTVHEIQQEKMNTLGVFIQDFLNFEALEQKLQEKHEKYKVLFIDTFFEPFIQKVHLLRSKFQHSITIQHELFENKKVQREILANCYNTHDVYSEKVAISQLNFKEIQKKIGSPFIIKPENGVGSSGVVKIFEEKEVKQYQKDFGEKIDCLVEEYIDGSMYSVDYFVDEDQSIYATPPIEMKLGKDIAVPDFFVYSCSVKNNIFETIPLIEMRTFLEHTVEVCGIKNIFIHHEFKYTSRKQLKTIEINGRIGGRRLKILQAGYGVNIYNLMFEKRDYLDAPIKNGFTAFAIYPTRQGKLLGYNETLLQEIESLISFSSFHILKKHFIGQTIGLTRDGFSNVGMIYIKNSNIIQFKKDYDFIESNFKNILILE